MESVVIGLLLSVCVSRVQAECIDPGRECVVFIAGGGSATEEQIQARKGVLIQTLGDRADVVVFSPSGPVPIFSIFDEARIVNFVNTHRASISNGNLHFIVSSAGVVPFERVVYPALPPRMGAIFLNQPFLPDGLSRPVLSANVNPPIHVVYDIAYGELALRASVAAGPSRFPSTANDGTRFYTPLAAFEGADLVALGKLHGDMVGLGEDFAMDTLRALFDRGLPFTLELLRRQQDEFGVPDPITGDGSRSPTAPPDGSPGGEPGGVGGGVGIESFPSWLPPHARKSLQPRRP